MSIVPRRESKRKSVKASRASSTSDSGAHVKVIPARSKPRTGGNSDWEAPAGHQQPWREEK